jgi:hypothetical protein
MITEVEKILLNLIKRLIVGKQLPSNINGDAGRAVERLLEDLGIEINRGSGPDILAIGWEVKSRKETATSAQTVTGMYADEIINTPYKLSPVYEKIKKQLRVTSNDKDVIINVQLVDFDQAQIQDILEAGYEHARKQISKNQNITCTSYKGFYGYFEQTKLPKSKVYDFRLSDSDIDDLIMSSQSTFKNIFEYQS